MLRHASRAANVPIAVGKRIRVRLAIEVVGRGVHDIDDSVRLLVHVPHADISLEGVAGVCRRIDERAPVAHRELRPVVHFGKPHPYERHAVRIPCVDFVRNHMALLVDEHDVPAADMVEVVVAEAVRVVLADINQHREVRERLASGIARHFKWKIAFKLIRDPVGVGPVVVEMRLRRADFLARISRRRKRAGNGLRLLLVVANRLELVVVSRSDSKARNRFAEAGVQRQIVRKYRPSARLGPSRSPNLVLYAALCRTAKRRNRAAHPDEIVRNLRKARCACCRRPCNRQSRRSRERARDGRRFGRRLVVSDGTERVVVGRRGRQAGNDDRKDVACHKTVGDRRPSGRFAPAVRPDLELDFARGRTTKRHDSTANNRVVVRDRRKALRPRNRIGPRD